MPGKKKIKTAQHNFDGHASLNAAADCFSLGVFFGGGAFESYEAQGD